MMVDGTKGNYVISEGREYLDVSGSAMTVGYDFIGRLPSPVSLLVYDNVYTQELTERLRRLSGFENVAYSTSGTEACDAALSRWDRPIISLEGSYHGLSYLTFKVSNGSGIDEKNSIVHLKVDARRDSVDNVIDYNEEILKKASRLMDLEGATLIVEPIQSDGGIYPLGGEFINYLREKVNEHSLSVIIDEVYTAFGRSGEIFLFNKMGVDADMVCIGKGMAAGLPMGAVLYNGDWDLPYHGALSMQGGNMATAYAALKVLDFLDQGRLERVRANGEQLIRSLTGLSEYVYEVRGKGYMIGIDFGGKSDFRPDVADSFRWELYENGIVATVVGKYNNVLKITPPLSVSEGEFKYLE